MQIIDQDSQAWMSDAAARMMEENKEEEVGALSATSGIPSFRRMVSL